MSVVGNVTVSQRIISSVLILEEKLFSNTVHLSQVLFGVNVVWVGYDCQEDIVGCLISRLLYISYCVCVLHLIGITDGASYESDEEQGEDDRSKKY